MASGRDEGPAGRPAVIVLRALGLGDLLAAVPALRALAAAFPDHRRLLAAPGALAPIAELSGAVDAVLDAAPLAPLGACHGAEVVAVNLHGRGPQSHRVLLEGGPLGRLISFRHPEVPESAGAPIWREKEHETRRWCRLLAESGIPADPADLDLDLPPELLAAAPEDARGATLVHPGGARVACRWPAERWAEVARAEAEAGRRVVVTGGPDEVDLARRVARGAGLPEGAVYAGKTGLPDLAALVAVAGRVASNDTGVAHLATALRTPSAVVFGPVSPLEWGPPDRPWHRVLWAGRVGDPHAPVPHEGLLEIPAADVAAALDGLPAADARCVASG